MKRSMVAASLSAITLMISGCGGGGGGGFVPVPTNPSDTISTYDPCAEFRDDGRNADKYLTAEYCRDKYLGKLGVSTAYSNGYTGDGVTIAVIDSGIDMDNYDISDNALKADAISYTSKYYDEDDDEVKDNTDGVSSDKISTINLADGGSGYTSAPTITIDGDGEGAEAVAIIKDGEVTGIYMKDYGSGYTTATITIDNNGTDGDGATIKNFVLGGYDDYGHGTSVAGIAAGVKQQEDENDTYDGFSIMGVAPDADLLAIKVLDDRGRGETWQIEKGIDYAVDQGAQILNMSLGTTDADAFADSKDHFSDALAANSTFVIAAGNDGLDCLEVDGSLDGQCSFPAALPWLDGNEDLLDGDGGWIVVGSVNADKTLSSFSNKAGVTKDNYLVAYGEGVISPTLNDAQSYNTGTSFAAPFVAGAMALMIEKYPHLSGKDVAQIFFDTAEDLGEEGVDDVYGNGLIDVYAAFEPIGDLGVISASSGGIVTDSSKVTATSTSLKISGTVGATLISSQALESAVAFDDYGRDFNVDLTQNISYGKTTAFDFKKFFLMNYGDIIVGFNKSEQKFTVGYKTTKNSKILFGYDNTLFGSEGEGSFGFKNANSYYASYIYSKTVDDFQLSTSLDYGLAVADSMQNSLISHIGNLHAMGGSIRASYKGLGIGYKIPLTTVSGDMDFLIPVSRNIDGTINYISSSENMNNKNFQRDYSLFYELGGRDSRLFMEYSISQNYGGLVSSPLYRNFSLNYSVYF